MQPNEEKGNDTAWQRKAYNDIASWLPDEQMKILCCCCCFNVKSEAMVQTS